MKKLSRNAALSGLKQRQSSLKEVFRDISITTIWPNNTEKISKTKKKMRETQLFNLVSRVKNQKMKIRKLLLTCKIN
jgi:hypothetical protein